MRTIRTEAEALGYMSQLTYAYSGLASLATDKGRWGEAVNYAKQASALAERLGNDFVLGHTLAVLCASENRQAQLGNVPDPRGLARDAIMHGERSLEVLEKLPPSDSLVLANTFLSEAYADQHEWGKATQYYAKALELLDHLQLPWLKEKIVADLGPKISSATKGVARADAAA